MLSFDLVVVWTVSHADCIFHSLENLSCCLFCIASKFRFASNWKTWEFDNWIEERIFSAGVKESHLCAQMCSWATKGIGRYVNKNKMEKMRQTMYEKSLDIDVFDDFFSLFDYITGNISFAMIKWKWKMNCLKSSWADKEKLMWIALEQIKQMRR